MCESATMRATEMVLHESHKPSTGGQGLKKEWTKSVAKEVKKRKAASGWGGGGGGGGGGRGRGAAAAKRQGGKRPRGKMVLSYVVAVEKDRMVTEVRVGPA